MWYRVCAAALIAATVAFAAGRALSQEGEMPEEKKQPEAEMEDWSKLHEPGEEHELLHRMVGEWDVTSTTYHDPTKPEVSKGTTVMRSVLGRRFVLQEYSVKMGVGVMEGVGLYGYDNQKKAYISTWADNLTTFPLHSEGTASADGKTTTLVGTFPGPADEPWRWRSVTTFVDADTIRYEGYMKGGDGKENKVVEAVYSRRK